MRLTTLCYMEHGARYLLMHRIRKKEDENAGKWIGIGGHLEEHESPEECMVREIREETGLVPENLRLRGIITFILPDWGEEMTFLYTCAWKEGSGDTDADGMPALPACPEGVLSWVPVSAVMSLPLWEGDRVFLPLLRARDDVFSLKLVYAPGGALTGAILDGQQVDIMGV
ncbi:MAG: 8-oxo-dGTP diphosphatase [Clostridia bacterium]|nr:8-oxo-dGTP diphosphatase [Clostridia bacterium]